MESSSVLQMYKRSEEIHGLRYIPFIGDGDCSSFSAVEKEMPYGPLVDIPKAECTNHVTKRMGSGLRRLLQNYKGKILKSSHGKNGIKSSLVVKKFSRENFLIF